MVAGISNPNQDQLQFQSRTFVVAAIVTNRPLLGLFGPVRGFELEFASLKNVFFPPNMFYKVAPFL